MDLGLDFEGRSKKGQLKIFFGFSAGVGKTYAMLKAAHREKARGVDVVAGYIEPHLRAETSALVSGLESVPLKEVEYKSVRLNEFNLEKTIERKPRLVLIDELAHTNAQGMRHEKRWQDILEVLENGIDVYTTVNVQHIESLNDKVASITGITVNETVPDSVFDNADEVELVDVEIDELLERFRAGKIYSQERTSTALNNFFTVEKLNALRELSLRRLADRLDYRLNSVTSFGQILVLVSPSPSSAKNIRTASIMAKNGHTYFSALYVNKEDGFSGNVSEEMDEMEEIDEMLKSHLRLAESLGGRIFVRNGDNIIEEITHFVRQNRISTIILGKTWQSAGKNPGFEDKIVAALPEINVLIIPDSKNGMKPIVKSALFEKNLKKSRIPAEKSFLSFIKWKGKFNWKQKYFSVQKKLTFLTALDCIFDAVNFEKKKADDFSKKEVLEKICSIFSSYFGKTSAIFCYNVSGFDFEKNAAGFCGDGFCGDGVCGKSENPINEERAFFVKNSFGDEKTDFLNDDFENPVVKWCAFHNEKCGFKTQTFAESKLFCLPVKTLQNVFVISFVCGKKGFSCEQEIFLEQVLRQIKSRFIEWEFQQVLIKLTLNYFMGAK